MSLEMWRLEEISNANRDSIKMGLRLNPPNPSQFYDVFHASVKIFDDKFRWAEENNFCIPASSLEEIGQLFGALRAAGRNLEASVEDAKVHENVALKIMKARHEKLKLRMIFAYNHGPSRKINKKLIDVFDLKISTFKAKLAKQGNDIPAVRFNDKAEQHPDMDKIKPVVKETEESALKVYKKKAIPVEETVDNDETLFVWSHYVKNDAFDHLREHPVAELYLSFQEELQDETVNTAVEEEQEVSPDDDSEHDVSCSDLDNELVKEEKTFDLEKIIDETDPTTESVDQDDVPPDDDTRPDVGKDLVEGDKTTQLSSLNTKPDIKQKENCVDKNEIDALKNEVSTSTRKTERFPYDPGKSFDSSNDVKEAESNDEDVGKTTPRVPIEDSDVYECSGSRSLIKDDLLFQQVAPSVVLCLHDHVCHIILRYPAIPLAQLHIIYRHPASCYVTNATKPFDIPDVNAEALVDEEPLDCEETLEESLEEVEEEFGTLGDEANDEIYEFIFTTNVSV